jgi:purine-binding chemotaxis protein CheW
MTTMGVVKRRSAEAREKMQEAGAQHLVFTLAGETYAMRIRSIKEVIQYGALTRVPLMPEFLRGVINLRGAVVPVVDLSVRFGRPGTEVGRRTCIVVLEVETTEGPVEIGILVDTVSEVLEIRASDIEPAPSFGQVLRQEFIEGIGKVGDQFLILLDVAHTLSIEELAGVQAAIVE